MKTSFVLSTLAILGAAVANTVPSVMGVEVVRSEGNVMVREVVSLSLHRPIFISNSNPISATLSPGSLLHQLRPRWW